MMKLACVRCKQKKLRCDRNEPCDKCILANAACTTAERKQRVSQKARDSTVVSTLNQRIDTLERALQATLPKAGPITVSADAPGRSSTNTTTPISQTSLMETSDDGHQTAQATGSRTGEEWFEKELRALRNFSIGHFNNRGLDSDSPVAQALTELDGALTDLGTVHEDPSEENSKALLTRDEARKAVQGALESLQGECFTGMLDRKLMESLTDIINSPHVQIDPAARLIYYNLVFHGSAIGEPKQQSVVRGLYLQCLKAVPAWQASATGTMLDLISTSLMTFTTAISLDYDLASRFHHQSCHFAKQLNLHRLDVLSAVGVRGRDLKNQRLGIWGLVLTDLFFRFFAGKDSSLSKEVFSKEVSLEQVGAFEAFDLVGSRLRAARTIVQLVWGRVIIIAKEFFEHYDQVVVAEAGKVSASQTFQAKVDELCDEIEEMVEDWQLVYLMRIKKTPLESWQMADTIIGSLNILLQMDKLRQGTESNISDRSLRVARVILDTTINFDETLRTSHKHNGLLYMYCIAFYPFRAFFSLYYNILLSNNPAECNDDVERLQKIGIVTMNAAQMRCEWQPIAKAILSLNQVTKHIQQSQKTSLSSHWATSWSSAQSVGLGQETASMPGMDSLPFDQQPDFTQWLPDLGDVHFATAEDFQQAAAQPDFRPIEYMQAIEDQFSGRNMQYGWWDGNAATS